VLTSNNELQFCVDSFDIFYRALQTEEVTDFGEIAAMQENVGFWSGLARSVCHSPYVSDMTSYRIVVVMIWVKWICSALVKSEAFTGILPSESEASTREKQLGWYAPAICSGSGNGSFIIERLYRQNLYTYVSSIGNKFNNHGS
jgi:hypothetical protein